MTKFSIPVSALSFVAMVSVAHADAQSLAAEKQCFVCHSLDRQIGRATAFRAIAERYRGKANVEPNLAQKIKSGGVGHWGFIPMPPAGWKRPDVSDAEAKELAAWILALH